MADITSNLIHHYALDDGSGTNPADSGSGADTGMVFTPGIGGAVPEWVAGIVGSHALFFDEADGMESTDIGIPTGAVSIAMWVKGGVQDVAPDGDDPTRVFLFEWGDGSGHYFGMLRSDQTGHGKLISNWSGVDDLTGATRCDDNVKHLVGISHSGTNLKIWVDGVADATATVGYADADDVSDLAIAKLVANTSYFEGIIDDIRVYTRELASGDWAALYALGLPPTGTGVYPRLKPRLGSIDPLVTTDAATWGQYPRTLQ